MEESSYQRPLCCWLALTRTVAGIATAECREKWSTKTYYHYCLLANAAHARNPGGKGNLFDNYGNLWRDRTQFSRLFSPSV